jgi:hypothetical protein
MNRAHPSAHPAVAGSVAVTVAAIGVGLLIVAGIAVTIYRLHQLAGAPALQSLDSYRIGDCVTLRTTPSGHPEIADADCGVDPSYTVGSIVQADATCPVPTYIRYVWSTADATVGALCLAENLRVGHCYQQSSVAKTLEVVDCAVVTSRGGEVVQRLDNVIDVTQCPLNTTAYAYPMPARTYCLTAPQSAEPV